MNQIVMHKSTYKTDIILFFGGLIAYFIGLMLMYIVQPSYAQVVQVIGLITVTFYSKNCFTFNIDGKYFKTIYTLYMLNNLWLISRVQTLNYVKIKEYMLEDFRLWPYIIPIIAFVVTTPLIFKILFNWIYWLGLLSLVLTVLLWKIYNSIPITEQSIWTFSSGCGFLLLTWIYHSKTMNIIAALAIILSLYVSTVFARRNIMLTNMNFIIFAFLLNLFLVKRDYRKKVFMFFTFLLVSIASLLFILNKRESDFKLIFNRASEDTREYVFNLYFEDMRSDLWLGKGVSGTYFCPLTTEDGEVIYRDLIECGYLQIVLKGGVLNLILFLAVLVPAVFLGIFNSNNIFSKACGFIVLLWLVDMIPYGLPSLSIRYMIVWICVGVCYNKRIRQLNETETKKFLSGQPCKLRLIKRFV